MDLLAKIISCHQHLQKAGIDHAFGGALALAWCTASARGTIDIDINLLVGNEQVDAVLSALPDAVQWTQADKQRLLRDSQHRLWWEATPLDLFFNSTNYHQRLAAHVRWEEFGGHQLPFLSCEDLAVFKVFFDRTKDWADLEAMQQAGTLDTKFVAGIISHYLGADDPRMQKLLDLERPG